MTQKLNLLTGGFLLLCNLIFFIPATFELLRSRGGPWGFGLILIPITIVGNLYVIPAVLAFVKKHRDNRTLLVINISGVIGCIFWIVFYLTTPSN